MQRIVPTIWFDHTAEQAVQFYTSIFPASSVCEVVRYPQQGLLEFQAEMAGSVLTIEFELAGHRFIAINAGPEFPLNPSVSFMVRFDPSADAEARRRLDELWASLSSDGRVLMPLQEYDFSAHYGWVQDRYGVNWQLMLTSPGGEPRPTIVPALMFGHTNQGRAQQAIEFYTSVFGGTVATMARYDGRGGAAAGQVMYADFDLAGQWFSAMDAPGQDFTFTCGLSLLVRCADQEDLDRLWGQLSAVPEAEQCGWCADQFGLSWQLVPANLAELMATPGAYAKLMAMKKIDISAFG